MSTKEELLKKTLTTEELGKLIDLLYKIGFLSNEKERRWIKRGAWLVLLSSIVVIWTEFFTGKALIEKTMTLYIAVLVVSLILYILASKTDFLLKEKEKIDEVIHDKEEMSVLSDEEKKDYIQNKKDSKANLILEYLKNIKKWQKASFREIKEYIINETSYSSLYDSEVWSLVKQEKIIKSYTWSNAFYSIKT